MTTPIHPLPWRIEPVRSDRFLCNVFDSAGGKVAESVDRVTAQVFVDAANANALERIESGDCAPAILASPARRLDPMTLETAAKICEMHAVYHIGTAPTKLVLSKSGNPVGLLFAAAIRALGSSDQQYRELLECRHSGQISDAQWQQHLADPAFAAWIERKAMI